MNQEEFDLYIELQPRLLEYRGEWQDGDEYFYVMFGTVYSYSDYSLKSNDESAIWIPKAIDPADPERIARGKKPRGLWGILREVTLLHGKWVAETRPGKITVGNTPTLALLLALREQWKEEKG